MTQHVQPNYFSIKHEREKEKEGDDKKFIHKGQVGDILQANSHTTRNIITWSYEELINLLSLLTYDFLIDLH